MEEDLIQLLPGGDGFYTNIHTFHPVMSHVLSAGPFLFPSWTVEVNIIPKGMVSNNLELCCG